MNELTKELIIEINKGIIQEWLEKNPTSADVIGVNQEVLDTILSLSNQQENMIMKAAYILGGIAWAQPFSAGNKRTAFVCADALLRMNGLKIMIDNAEDSEYLRKLLLEVQEERSELNSGTIAKLILYVTKRIRMI